ncbi:Fur family transcriptional regulator [Chloroflexota bacterium]
MSCYTTLIEKGLRLTPQRRLILDIIHDTREHLTAEGIIDVVQTRMPGINKSTVYRTLELLEETGCVYKSESDDHCIYHHDEEGHHHHLVCIRCGKTVDCDENLFTPMEKSIHSKYGYKVDFKHMVVHGLCEKCRSSTS